MSQLKTNVKVAVILFLILFAALASAKEATPMVADPEMEKTVNEISAELRCLVCQNQTIADSSAGLAVDLKNQVREMVETGQSQEEIVDYMVKRYGDFVLYRPPVKATTVLLWVGPFLLLLIGLTILVVNLRKRTALIKDGEDLSLEENERLKTLLEAGSVEKNSTQQAEEEKS